MIVKVVVHVDEVRLSYGYQRAYFHHPDDEYGE
jgi:hypothetical protein